jgi:hypothetical protein
VIKKGLFKSDTKSRAAPSFVLDGEERPYQGITRALGDTIGILTYRLPM